MLDCGPSLQETRENQESEFENLHGYCMRKENYLVDEDKVLRVAKDDEFRMVVPSSLVDCVLQHLHGSSLAGHY